MSDERVTLWRCPVCGKTESDTSQSARYCGSTRACTRRIKGDSRVVLTAMERVSFVPASRLAEAQGMTPEWRAVGLDFGSTPDEGAWRRDRAEAEDDADALTGNEPLYDKVYIEQRFVSEPRLVQVIEDVEA